MQFKDYYETLGIGRDASQEDVKRAYRRLARKYHPDVSKEADAETRFKEVGEAYEALKDPEKRAAYDRFGKDWKHGQEFRPPPGWERQFDFRSDGFSGASGFSDFFEALFGQGIGPGGFHGARGPGQARARGGDQNAKIEIPLEDAYRGATRTITLHNGRTLSVKIPRGITGGQRIRLSGQGASGMGGGSVGDLYLTVTHAAHPLFRTEGRDVHLTLPVALWEAALGATVAVPTLGGRVDLKIPPRLPIRSDPAAQGARASGPVERRPVRRAGDRRAARRHPGGGVAVPEDGGVDALRSEGRPCGLTPLVHESWSGLMHGRGAGSDDASDPPGLRSSSFGIQNTLNQAMDSRLRGNDVIEMPSFQRDTLLLRWPWPSGRHSRESGNPFRSANPENRVRRTLNPCCRD